MFHRNCNIAFKVKKLAMHPNQVLKISNAANSSEIRPPPKKKFVVFFFKKKKMIFEVIFSEELVTLQN
jgi:hypothetical protein